MKIIQIIIPLVDETFSFFQNLIISFISILGRVSLEYIDANTNQRVHTPSVPFLLDRPNQIDPQSSLLQVNYALDLQRNRAETSQILKQAVEEHNYERAREIINTQLAKIR